MGLIVRAAVLTLSLFWCTTVTAGDAPLRSDGIHTQPWMKSMTFLDFKEDLAEAKAKGKGLVMLFEQVGCGACERLHVENFSIPELVKTVTDNYEMIQINMFGDNELTDFDGQVMSERELAQKMLVNFSPTTIFYDENGKEIFRVPGFLKAYFYQSAFEYVADKGPQNKLLFPRWLKAKSDRLKAEGKTPG
ncbi:MAG: thioredoxin family protein [Rhodospirillales bacterium]|nr:thioredoxin family protein [Rhodospirillales bacterium]MCW8863127.1 thioredoxin family protein [Rhodospirillales bacterium]MCW8951335.1 thioredoxin family protein [Rhodospirillales bacterium]MCW8970529.1 thioredoxin family protein [Rhodospirillales bacterium]MCW9001913.1 thioredoxin family protein [Rhodospirillales bacterium]